MSDILREGNAEQSEAIAEQAAKKTAGRAKKSS